MSWNVNGVRAIAKKGFLDWIDKEGPEVICLQETKANEEQLDEELKRPKGYHSYWHSAEKAGYSGVATFSKHEPLEVSFGMGVPDIDREGRVLITEFKDFALINCYFPNSQREGARLKYKLFFNKEILRVCEEYRKKGKNVVICGDFNVAHQEIDLKNPKSNKNNAGFLPEERAWMSEFLEKGYCDVFRDHEKGEGHYTWWSYRFNARKKNIGWRIDYHCVNEEFSDRVKSVCHHPNIEGSDHCPIELNLK